MDTGSMVVIATQHAPVVMAIQQAMRDRAVVVQHTLPHIEAILRVVGRNTKALVVVHACRGDVAWLELIAGIRRSNPSVRLLGVGDSTDIEAVARGIVYGLHGYVPLSPGLTAIAVLRAVVAALSGVEPAADTVYARVKEMLPLGPFASGRYRSPFGTSFSQSEAIEHCLALGLTEDEAARYLNVARHAVTAAARCSDAAALPTPVASWTASYLIAVLGFIATGLIAWTAVL